MALSTDDDRGPLLQAVAVAFLVLANTSFALRAYVRLFITRAFGADDYLMAAAAMSFIFFVSSALVGIHYGTGQHMADLDVADRRRAMQVGGSKSKPLARGGRG